MANIYKILNEYDEKIHSQFGEDGIIKEILNRIKIENLDKYCVEFGARDGISDSNTYNLIKNHKYKAVLIEGDKRYFKKLCKNFVSDEIIKLNKFVDFYGENSLDKILQNTIIPTNFDKVIDFLYLDSLDGQFEGASFHQLEEIKIAKKNLKKDSLVLLDDKGDKTNLSIDYMLKNDFRIINETREQVLLSYK